MIHSSMVFFVISAESTARDSSDDFHLTSNNVPCYNGHHDSGRRCAKQPPLESSLMSPRKKLTDELISREFQDVHLISSNQSFAIRSSSSSSLGTDLDNIESVNILAQQDKALSRPPNDSVAKDDGHPTDWSKALLSPIKFIPQPVAKDSQPSESQSERTAPSEARGKPARYIFYPPKNPSDRPRHIYDCHSSVVPRRRLSYGEPLTLANPKARRAPAASSGIIKRQSGESTDEDDRHSSWLDGSLKATATVRPWYSEPTRPKPRLWLDLAGDGEKIEEAVSRSFPESS